MPQAKTIMIKSVTTRGMKESDMEKIVDLIDDALLNHENPSKLEVIKKEVNGWVSDFPLYQA